MKDNVFIQVLGVAPFRNLWLSQVLSQVALNLLVFFLTLRIFELTQSNIFVSIFVLTILIPNFLFSAIAGVFVDRTHRKIVMFLCHFLRIFAVIGFLLSPESLLWIYILMAAVTLITQFFVPAEAASIPEMVPDKKMLLTANSLFSLTFFTSVIAGNILAGPFLKLLGVNYTLLLVAAMFLLATIFTSRIPGPKVHQWIRNKWQRVNVEEEKTLKKNFDLFAELKVGLNFLHEHRLVRHSIFLMVIAQIIIAMLSALAPGIGSAIVKIEVADVSLLIMAPAALGMIMGGFIVGNYFHKMSKEKLIILGFFAVAVVMLLFAYLDLIASAFGLPIIAVTLAITTSLGLANAFMDIPINTIIQEHTPLEIRSRIYGVLAAFTGGASIIPVLAAGIIADTLGVRAVLIIMAVVLVIFSFFNRRILKSIMEIVKV